MHTVKQHTPRLLSISLFFSGGSKWVPFIHCHETYVLSASHTFRWTSRLLKFQHNIWKTPDQDPAAWQPAATAIMITALRIRYTLLPHYYTLFFKAHTAGSTVIRPLFHEFPKDETTLDIYLQFLVGSHIMIVPVTDHGARQVRAYIPRAT